MNFRNHKAAPVDLRKPQRLLACAGRPALPRPGLPRRPERAWLPGDPQLDAAAGRRTGRDQLCIKRIGRRTAAPRARSYSLTYIGGGRNLPGSMAQFTFHLPRRGRQLVLTLAVLF